MRPAGLAAFEARTEARTGIYSYERPLEALTDDETARFRADDGGLGRLGAPAAVVSAARSSAGWARRSRRRRESVGSRR